MNFEISNQRAQEGNDIFVKITVGVPEEISKVETELDSAQIGSDELEPPHALYQRAWSRQGAASPGRDHVLNIKVTDGKGKSSTATHRWTDTF